MYQSASTQSAETFHEYFVMAMKQVLLHTKNPSVIGTPQCSHNIMHCISLDHLYNLVRACGSSSLQMQNFSVKGGTAMVSQCTSSLVTRILSQAHRHDCPG